MTDMEMIMRPRRLRSSETLRRMVRETRMDKSSLIYPLFVKDGEGIKEEIPSMEGQYRYSVDQLPYALEELLKAGVDKVMFFGKSGLCRGWYCTAGFAGGKAPVSGDVSDYGRMLMRVHFPWTLRNALRPGSRQ